jgi:hypothetical protein
MSRPLLISDCDDVLLHFAPHFADWVAEAHGYHFSLDVPAFAGALRDDKGVEVTRKRAFELLDNFFDREMHRQRLVGGALDALRTIGAEADIVILTNIGDQYRANRIAQLERFDIRHRVLCNQGGKGRPVLELIEQMKPRATVFVDDLPVHHESVARHAHTRIDAWSDALPWILDRMNEEVPA